MESHRLQREIASKFSANYFLLTMSKQTHGSERQWYAIHTYSGYEDAVARNLKQRIESFGMKDKIFKVVVPTEKKIKIKGGRKSEVREKVFPGYVLVDMVATDDAWSVVRNTPQVTGFVGTANQAVPLSQDEVDKILKRAEGETVRHAIDLALDDAVIIIDGPFKDLEGKVGEIDEERGKVKVLVPMFGRETPVELEADQVQRV
ncbi:MAG: Transcription antitermination protein nusG [Parcubacteria group bacterium GW2011_GWA2_51_10]|nr:MAG: Transcription antitermination protein nusG [Parcubacteria group bacterium GW2011_GWA2_51_10]